MKAGNPIQTLSPDGFVQQFFDLPPQDEAMRQRLLTTDGETYRLRSSGLYRLEDMAQYIRFPVPPLRNLHYDFVFLRSGTSARTDGLSHYELGQPRYTFLGRGRSFPPSVAVPMPRDFTVISTERRCLPRCRTDVFWMNYRFFNRAIARW